MRTRGFVCGCMLTVCVFASACVKTRLHQYLDAGVSAPATYSVPSVSANSSSLAQAYDSEQMILVEIVSASQDNTGTLYLELSLAYADKAKPGATFVFCCDDPDSDTVVINREPPIPLRFANGDACVILGNFPVNVQLIGELINRSEKGKAPFKIDEIILSLLFVQQSASSESSIHYTNKFAPSPENPSAFVAIE